MKNNRVCACGQPTLTISRQCRSCHSSYMRSWRKKRKRTARERELDRARAHRHKLVVDGAIIKRCCDRCGDPRAEAYSLDPENPKALVYLCRVCRGFTRRRRFTSAPGRVIPKRPSGAGGKPRLWKEAIEDILKREEKAVVYAVIYGVSVRTIFNIWALSKG